MILIPSQANTFLQPNTGESNGNILASFGIDLDTNRGKLRTSEGLIEVLTDADNPDFAGYAAAFVTYGSSTPKYFAISDKAFSATDITGTWSEETVGSEPDSGNTIMDATFFDGLALVCEATDIKSWNGTTWASWWQGTAGQSALLSGERHFIKVGPAGNLYIVDDGNLVYRVTPAGSVSKTGAGTLDFSATNYEITTMQPSSSRMWFGTRNKAGGECVIIEWDMSPAATTANRLHRIGSSPVRCIAVWNDTPIAILQNGRIIYFNGSAFVEWPNIRLPGKKGQLLDDDFIHPNGWAIIDNYPHFLMTGKILGNTPETDSNNAYYSFPAGIYCLDPEFGFYMRYAIGSGTNNDYGMAAIPAVGALFAIENEDTKFVCSYEYKLDNAAGNRSVLAYHDKARTNATRSHIVTPFIASEKNKFERVELYFDPLNSGEQIDIYYRTSNTEPVIFNGAWASTSQINSAVTGTGIEEGNVAFIKRGASAGTWVRISDVEETSGTTAITLAEATNATAAETGVLEVFNFKYMGTVNSTTLDQQYFTVPESNRRRKMQFLFALRTNAGNTQEIDRLIIE